MSIELVMLSNHLCYSILFWPSVFPSIRIFANESALWIRWSKYWNLSFSNSPSNEYSRLISFRIDWFNLLAVQGTRKSSPVLFESISSSVLSLLMVQFSHPYVTTGKIIALTVWTFVGKVMSLLFNMLSMFIIAYLVAQMVRNLLAMHSVPGLGRFLGEGNGNPLQYSCLENFMDRGTWWTTVHGSQRVGHDWVTNPFTFSFVIAFLPRGKHLLISWLQSSSSDFWSPRK